MFRIERVREGGLNGRREREGSEAVRKNEKRVRDEVRLVLEEGRGEREKRTTNQGMKEGSRDVEVRG